MKDTHITNILDNKPLAALSETDLQAIRAHTASCADCARAFKAARISALLLNERAEETNARRAERESVLSNPRARGVA